MEPLRDAPAIQPRLEVGTRLGNYEVIALIHQGAHVEVYAARSEGTDVTLKVPSAASTLGPVAAGRFESEATDASLVHHPNIPRIVAVGAVEGVPFLCTAAVDAVTLAEWLAARGPMTFVAAVDLLLPLLSALVLLRERNVAHGELKTNNVLVGVGPAGVHPWLVDVGVAKRDPIDDRRRDVGAVGLLLHALLSGDDQGRAWTADSLRSALQDFGVPGDIAEMLARPMEQPPEPSPSVRSLGRSLAPFASPEVRLRWERDFAPSSLRPPVVPEVPRVAKRLLGLLVALALLVVGLWMIRDRIRPPRHTPLIDRWYTTGGRPNR